jgi:hypothetical protein
MQCGCPITPGGIWDANKFQIAAQLENGAAVPLTYAGEASTFQGSIPIPRAGSYVLDVYAYDPSDGNTGLVKFPLTAR